MAPSCGLELEVGPGPVGVVVGQAGADEVQGGPLPRVLRGRDRVPVLSSSWPRSSRPRARPRPAPGWGLDVPGFLPDAPTEPALVPTGAILSK